MHTRASRAMFIVPGITILVALSVFGVLAYLVSAREGSITSLERSIRTNQGKEASLRTTKLLLADIEDSGTGIDSYLLAQSGPVALIGQIESLGTRAGLSSFAIGSVSAEPTIPPVPDLEELKLQMSGSGTWTAVMRFLTLVESLPLPVSFTNSSLSRATDGTWNLTMTIAVSKLK